MTLFIRYFQLFLLLPLGSFTCLAYDRQKERGRRKKSKEIVLSPWQAIEDPVHQSVLLGRRRLVMPNWEPCGWKVFTAL